MTSLKFILPALLCLVFINPCKSQKFKTHESGLQYRIYKPGKGPKPKVGDMVTIKLDFYKPDSSLVFSTNGQPPVDMALQKPQFRGDFMEGLSMLSAGDSATFLVSSDSMDRFAPQKGFFTPGTFMRYEVKLVNVRSEAQFKKDQEAEARKQIEEQDKLIQDYLKKNDLKGERQASGLYIVTMKKGEGPKPKPGNKVSVHYTGTLLDGKKFDSSRDRGQPFEFVLGRDGVIQGWLEGLQLMNEGTQAKLLIPSELGYGSQGAGGQIPGNAILVFDVELLKVQ